MRQVGYAVAVLGLGTMFAAGAMAAPQASSQGQASEAQASQAPAASVIPADQQASKEQIEKLFEVMRLRQQMQNMTKMMPAIVQQQMQQQLQQMQAQSANGRLTPEQTVAIQKVLAKYVDRTMSLYPVDEMLSDLEGLYQRHLSRSDIEAFIAFYQSPAGQHLLDQQPAIMHEYMPMLMRRVQDRSKPMTEEMMKEMQEITQSGGTPGATVPANK